jgi:hypothetical protein
MSRSWYIARDGAQHGPISEIEFTEVMKHGHLLPSDLIWREGLDRWVPATDVLEQWQGQLAIANKEKPSATVESREGTTPHGSVTGPRIVVGLIAAFLTFVAWMEPNSVLYRLGAGLNGAFFGAVGGALGALLSVLIERFFARTIPRSWKIGAASVGFLLGAGFGKLGEVGVDLGVGQVRDAAYQEYVRPKIDRVYIQRTLKNAGTAGQLYRLVEEKEPATFDAIVQVLVANLRSNATQDQVINMMREQFIERISKPRMKFLADDDLVLMFELTGAMVGALAQTNPRLCIAMMQGKPFGDLRPFVRADILAREQLLMERLIVTAPRQVLLLPAADLQAINTKVAVELYKIHGDALEVLDPAKAVGREKAACVMYADYLKGILRLPRNEAVALLRALVVDPARLG